MAIKIRPGGAGGAATCLQSRRTSGMGTGCSGGRVGGGAVGRGRLVACAAGAVAVARPARRRCRVLPRAAGDAEGGASADVGSDPAAWRRQQQQAGGNGAGPAGFADYEGAYQDEGADGDRRRRPPPSKVASGWRSVTQPMRDFGIGRTSRWEGGVGLFIVTAVATGAALMSWMRGAVGSPKTSYVTNFSFPAACGIQIGTLVRVRGVTVGSVTGISPNLKAVEVEAKILDDNVRIPKNALVEANQSGLISESLVDITPQHPIPSEEEQTASPLNVAECEREGLIVCNGGHIEGVEGVSMDELVKYCTKFAKELDRNDSLEAFMALADAAKPLMEKALPLLDQVNEIVEEVGPLLKDVSDGSLVENVENLMESASQAAADFHRYAGATRPARRPGSGRRRRGALTPVAGRPGHPARARAGCSPRR